MTSSGHTLPELSVQQERVTFQQSAWRHTREHTGALGGMHRLVFIVLRSPRK